MSDAIARECAVLEDVALVRVLTVDKEQYDAPYLDVAQKRWEDAVWVWPMW